VNHFAEDSIKQLNKMFLNKNAFKNLNLTQEKKKLVSQILRKVDNRYEDYYLNKKDVSILYRHLRVKTEIDYFSNLSLLREAIENWKNLNPLLRCKVHKLHSSDVKLFVMEDDKRLKNVKFLTAKSYRKNLNTENHNEIIKMLIERDINYDYDYSKSPLWTLKFYKLQDNLYDVVFTVNHAISEDRCNIHLVFKLLDIIEKMHKNEYVKEKAYQLLPAMYGLYVHKPPPSEINYDSYSYHRPSFIKPELAQQDSLNSFSTSLTSQDVNDIQVIDIEKNTIYSNLSSLLEISRRNFSKCETIELNVNNLIKKCKQWDCKITSCLNIISIMALKDLYIEYGNEEEKQRSISYGNVISVRNFLEDESVRIKENMGMYIMNMMNKYKGSKNGSELISNENFWSLVKNDSDFMMENIKNGKIFQTPYFEEENFINDDAFLDLFMTNVGFIPNSYSKNSLHTVESNLFGSFFSAKDYIFYQLTYSTNNRLFVRILYNSNFIQQKYVMEYILNFKRLYFKFIDS
jgi:hypothetical protein